ncbi:MAG: sigma 54-interacting transcriptional regulator [Deltaproteobacteria bacterium]|nr:sigma 54-interacting transcriptional regulator [Deltaproteobacteria bacterium]
MVKLPKSTKTPKVEDAIFMVNSAWELISFNRAAEELFGLKSEDVIGRNCHAIFGSDKRFAELFSALCPSVSAGKIVTDFNLVIENPEKNTLAAVLATAVPIPDKEGKPSGAIVIFQDASSSSMCNRMIIDSIADGVFTVDRNWKITSFNAAAEAVTGWKREDAIGKFCGDVFHSSICGKSCAIAQSLYSGKPVANRSITIATIEGNRIPISICASPLTDHEGNIIGGVETFRDLSAITMLQKQLSKSYTFDEIISKSTAMQRIFSILPEIARSPSNVLILGESGTGKELVARAIFHASTRSEEPFVAVNCGALPETLLESELFGYKAGAFTDAKQNKLGRFAAAEKGTLFLDEIGDIPQSLQVKLLRFLQNKVYEPLGSNVPVKADVRIITATNRDLRELVNAGLFREDLFYRLNVVKIHLPPLRERMEDIPILIDHFIKQYSAQQGKDIVGISSGALILLMRYNFPGNIRELENIIEYAFILCEGGLIQPEHLPEPFGVPAAKTEGADRKPTSGGKGLQTLEEIEKQAIYMALERNSWKRMATCRELAISKDTLRRKITRFNLESEFDKKLDELTDDHFYSNMQGSPTHI